MYKFTLKQYKTSLFDKYLFDDTLNYLIKKNDYSTLIDVLANTNWKSEANKKILRGHLTTCAFYKKTGYKIFELLLSHVEYQDYHLNETVINAQMIKHFDLQAVIRHALNQHKTSFVNKILTSEPSLLECALKEAIKTKDNDFVLKHLEKLPSSEIFEACIGYCLEAKNIPLLSYFAKDKNIFLRKRTYLYDLSNPYYIDRSRYVKAAMMNSAVMDILIIEHLNPSIYTSMMAGLISHHKNQLVFKWIEKLQKKELSFGFKEIQPRDMIKEDQLSLNTLSLKSLESYYDFYNLSTFESKIPIEENIHFTNSLSEKVLKGIKHHKVGYLEHIQEKFNLKNLLFNEETIAQYYSRLSETCFKVPSDKLPPLSLEQRIFTLLQTPSNPYLVTLIASYPWEEIETCMNDKFHYKINASHKKELFSLYLNQNLDIKAPSKKNKI